MAGDGRNHESSDFSSRQDIRDVNGPLLLAFVNKTKQADHAVWQAAVEVLYKDDVMTRFYKRYDWASEACATRFRHLVRALIGNGKRVIRVLEVGAGT